MARGSLFMGDFKAASSEDIAKMAQTAARASGRVLRALGQDSLGGRGVGGTALHGDAPGSFGEVSVRGAAPGGPSCPRPAGDGGLPVSA
ncbi:MAG: hypothetical protein LBQ12_01315 [Deltaproteobacteria bacterium]|nr:hypothetical protein [Deltaproteobacteria bacterium]